ncbi:hypothetical protein CD30_16625 [Ureibacillus massiliensis 4400831 = CIP 108448 = CCUG 49529]|uniref:DUF2178 domain-containing protein n=1 Tax=Ureibacillus massiliensis 4400831 = CIP 108448 = CCUG 49529 TaxID=1211035 RepID=A0A0A3J1B3_9BACL|nr:hypothetical protein [Ureibacillus massiliensis]KGR89520.1 hypothetical protein CD30_16625 [Ureibacillus massiliensis 4400831 = CIP 108448 = CCUG 49529]
MRLPNWSLLLLNVFMCTALGFVSISSYINGATVWWIWGLIAFLYAYMTINRIIKSQKDGWASEEIVEDQRTTKIRLVSCSIGFIYILLFLTAGIIAFLLGYVEIDPVIYMVFAIVTSILVFVISQMVQFYLT